MPTGTDLAHVVDRTALIENILNQVIEAYLEPRKEAFFFWEILMDSSILSLGSKVKVAMAISHRVSHKLDSNSLHTVLRLRNAFAHHAADAHPMTIVGRTPHDDRDTYLLHVIQSNGRVDPIERDKGLSDFDRAFTKAKESLLALLAVIRTSGTTGAPTGKP